MLILSVLFFFLTLFSGLLAFGGLAPEIAEYGRFSFAVCTLFFVIFMQREFRRLRAYT